MATEIRTVKCGDGEISFVVGYEPEIEAVEADGEVIGFVLRYAIPRVEAGRLVEIEPEWMWSIKDPVAVMGRWGDSTLGEPSRDLAIDQVVRRKARGREWSARPVAVAEYHEIRGHVVPAVDPVLATEIRCFGA